MSEKTEQIALIQRAAYNTITRDYLWATPNGGFRRELEARSLKLQGVKKGVPDLFLAYPCGLYHGLFIELKRPPGSNGSAKGSLTADQAIMLDRLNKIGYLAHVAYGWQQAWEQIENYLKLGEK